MRDVTNKIGFLKQKMPFKGREREKIKKAYKKKKNFDNHIIVEISFFNYRPNISIKYY